MIELSLHPDGVLLPVRAHAGARRSQVCGEQDGALQVQVTTAPERRKANRAIIALLARTLRLRKSQFELVAGETSPRKRFLVRGETPAGLQARLDALAS